MWVNMPVPWILWASFNQRKKKHAAFFFPLEQCLRLCLRWTSTHEAKVDLFAAAQQGNAQRCYQLVQMRVDPSSREEVTGFSVTLLKMDMSC